MRDQAAFLVVLVLVLGALITVATQGGSQAVQVDGQDLVSFNQRRFEEVRKLLPARGVVGYVSDAPVESGPGAFYLAQYFLAPVILTADATPELVIGNFRSSASIPAILEQNHLAVVRDFQNGVLLLRKASR